MKKILFGITSLTLGGAERVLVDLVNQLCRDYDITIFTIYAKGELEKELLPAIKVKSLYSVSYQELSNFQKHISIPLKVLWRSKKIYQKIQKEKYDVEIAFLEGAVTRIFSNQREKTKKIVWIHSDISRIFGQGIKAKIKRYMDKKIYAKYENIVFVSQDNLECFKKIYPTIQNKKQVIYNYIDKNKVLAKAKEEPEELWKKDVPNFVTVARLVEAKGIDRLIKVHKKLIEEGLAHRFYIIGDGPEKEKLEGLIQKEKISNTFILLGKKENPYPYIKMADYFVLLSYYEGYSMVSVEAQILQKYIIITDTAARESLQNYENYEIANNSEEGIFETLKQILTNPKKEKKQEEYQNQEVLEKVEKLIES